MTDETTPHSPAPRWVFALSVLVFLPPVALATFFPLGAVGWLETYQQLTLPVVVFLGVVWFGAILYGIVRTQNLSGFFLLALPIMGLVILIIFTEQSVIRHAVLILTGLIGLVAFGVLFVGYAFKLWSLRSQHHPLSLAQSLTLLILATTTCIVGTVGANIYFDLYSIRDRATINSTTSYLLVTFDGYLFLSYVHLYVCDVNGIGCDLLRIVGESSADAYDTPDQITWEVGENDGITIITILRDDVPIHTEYIE